MRNNNIINRCFRFVWVLTLTYLVFFQTSCKKYLDRKPRQDLVIPSTLNDLRGILDNQTTNNSSPGYLEFVADNFYLSTISWNTAAPDDRVNYLWDKDARILYNTSVWNAPYNAIYAANFVLDNLSRVSTNESNTETFNIVKGEAIFYRAFMFYQLAQLFCKPYSVSASTDPGIVLRLTSAVEEKSVRATVQQTYDQIVNDLKAATELLPATSLFSLRPNKTAAYAALARVYLSMREYSNALKYADATIALNNKLLDYNSITNTANLPNFENNPEIIYVSLEVASPPELGPGHGRIDTLLYQSYNDNDLRKTIFFDNSGGNYYWKGSYFPNNLRYTIFDGIATDEIYLIRAECRARAGDVAGSLSDLNLLLRNRWKTGQYNDLTATDSANALAKVLVERRKELLFRGLRWTDLRRLNLEGADITLTRIINGVEYSLPPNDLRWLLPIPDLEISRSGISQNPR